jgi:hypothetical protein
MMRLAELVARRDVGDAFAQVQILNHGVSLMWK